MGRVVTLEEKLNEILSSIDCEQSLSFPSVFLAFPRASVALSSSEQRAAKPRLRCAGSEEEEKERDCGGIFDLLDLPLLTPI